MWLQQLHLGRNLSLLSFPAALSLHGAAPIIGKAAHFSGTHTYTKIVDCWKNVKTAEERQKTQTENVLHKKLSDLSFNEIDPMNLLDNEFIYLTFEQNVRAHISLHCLETARQSNGEVEKYDG